MHTLKVENEVQVALVRKVLVPEVLAGHFARKPPLGHGEKWRDLRVVSGSGFPGPVNFSFDRLYNFVDPELLTARRDLLLAAAQEVLRDIEWSEVKRELVQLSRIVAGRLRQPLEQIERRPT